MHRIPVLISALLWSMPMGRLEARSSACNQALPIFLAAASIESSPRDTLLNSPPEFPSVAVRIGSGLTPLTADSLWWQGNWRGQKPTQDHVQRWFATSYRSITICLPPRASGWTLGTIPRWKGGKAPSKTKARYLAQASYPVVDRSGSHALIVYSTGALPGTDAVGGKSELILFERRGGQWRKVGEGLISVS
jgi:hypothetical protein